MSTLSNKSLKFGLLVLFGALLFLIVGFNSEPTTYCDGTSQDGGAGQQFTQPRAELKLLEGHFYPIAFHVRDEEAHGSRVCQWKFSLNSNDQAVVLVEMVRLDKTGRKVTTGDALPNVTLSVVTRHSSIAPTFAWQSINISSIFMNRSDVLEVHLKTDNHSAQSIDPGLGLNLTLITKNSCPGGCLFRGFCYLLRPVYFLCGASSIQDCKFLAQHAAQFGKNPTERTQFLNSCHSTREFREAHGNTVVLAINTNGTTSYPNVKANGKYWTIRAKASGGPLKLVPVDDDDSSQPSAVTPDNDASTIDKSAQGKSVIIGIVVCTVMLVGISVF